MLCTVSLVVFFNFSEAVLVSSPWWLVAPPREEAPAAEMVEDWWSRPAPLATLCWWLKLATGCAALGRGTLRHLGEGYPPGPYPGCPATIGSVT